MPLLEPLRLVAWRLSRLVSGFGLSVLASVAAFLPLGACSYADASKVMLRQNLFLAGAALVGVGLGPMLSAAGLTSVLLAVGTTTGIFAGFSLAALKSPSAEYLRYTGLLAGVVFAALGLTVFSFVGAWLNVSVPILLGVHAVTLCLVSSLFTFFIAYDTQAMVDRAAAGNADHVTDTFFFFLDIWQVFEHLLECTSF